MLVIQEIKLHIILLSPTPAVDFGLQQGTGNNYETIQKQRSKGEDLSFTLSIKVKGDRSKDTSPKFSGDFVHGTTNGKFIYIDIGTCAGQLNTPWSRRLKIPLTGITWNDIDQSAANPTLSFETIVPGSGRDGGPNCATVKPFNGWSLK